MKSENVIQINNYKPCSIGLPFGEVGGTLIQKQA